MARLAIIASLLVIAFVASELILPRLAERRLRGELGDTGQVHRVKVRAFPAIKLLLGRADRVEVHVGVAAAGQGEFADLVDSTRRTKELEARADRFEIGPLVARDLRLDKKGDDLDAEAAVTEADLQRALPPAIGLRPVAAGGGELVLEASAGLLGAQVAVRARLSSREGALVIAPDGVLGGLASLTVFDDPRVRIDGVGARERPDGYTFTAEGRLAG